MKNLKKKQNNLFEKLFRRNRHLLKLKKSKPYKKFKRLSTFIQGLLIYISVALLALVIFFIVFYNFIADYEESMPAHAVENVVAQYNEKDLPTLIENGVSNYNPFESIDLLSNAYYALFDGKEITYEEDTDFRESAPVYLIKADGVTIAKVWLETNDKNFFGFDVWEMSDLDIYDYIYTANTITVSAPSGSEIEINGVSLDDSFITATDQIPSLLTNITDLLPETPTNTQYTISGFFETPEITGVDSDGNELSVASSDNSYTLGLTADSDFISTYEDYVITIMESYGKKYINMDSDMSRYLLTGGPFEENVSLSTTYWYPSEKILNYEFQNESVSNYIIYSDECFSVDISFDLYVYFNDSAYETQNESANMTWLFIKDGDNYLLADFSYKN